jgi:hypothetical protein
VEEEVEQELLELMLLLLLEEMVELDHLVHYQVHQELMQVEVEVQENHQLLEKQLVLVELVVVELELFLLLLVELEQLIQVVVEDQDHLAGGAGGSGIVIVKELNKASGSWPLRAQFSARKSGTWVETQASVSFDYLVVAGGGGGNMEFP